MSLGAMILAAGKDLLGDVPKATMELSGTSVIKREINLLREAGVAQIIVVAGRQAEELEKHLAHRKVQVVVNEEGSRGDMLLSVKKGLESLAGSCAKVVVLPVDIPAIDPKTIKLLDEAGCDGHYDLAVPINNGKSGHPVLIHMDSAVKIMDYQGKGGINGMVEQGLLRPCYVEVPDSGIAIELNQTQDSKRIVAHDSAMRNAVSIQPALTVSLARNKEFFTAELAAFLKLVDKTGSMNASCQQMGIAYSRAWTMVNQAENQLGYPLIERLAGGKGGGSSRLTQECIKLTRKYDQFSDALNRESMRIFSEIFDK
jgi:molybdate transport repressor ModE-like protein